MSSRFSREVDLQTIALAPELRHSVDTVLDRQPRNLIFVAIRNMKTEARDHKLGNSGGKSDRYREAESEELPFLVLPRILDRFSKSPDPLPNCLIQRKVVARLLAIVLGTPV